MGRIEDLACCLQTFPAWESVSVADLFGWLELELGGSDVLENGILKDGVIFQPVVPKKVVVVCSGTHPFAAWQALARGALLGVSEFFLKLPGDATSSAAIENMAAELKKRGLVKSVRCSFDISPEDWVGAELTVVFGSDETVEFFRKQAGTRFLGYGHRASFGVVFEEDISADSAAAAARDLFCDDQMGCLSPQLFYLVGGEPSSCVRFAEMLAEALRQICAGQSVAAHDTGAAARVHSARREAVFNGLPLICSPSSTDWTVIVDSDSSFKLSCGHRVVFLKHARSLGEVARCVCGYKAHISAVGMSRVEPFDCGATRFCRLGKMSLPRPSWRQDGTLSLADWVSWRSIELD